MNAIEGRASRVALIASLGLALGLFVAVSVFTDGGWSERGATIGAILLAYGLASAAVGSRASAWGGLGLALPGLAVLALSANRGAGDWWYLLYGALIVAFAVGGPYAADGGGAESEGARSG